MTSNAQAVSALRAAAHYMRVVAQFYAEECEPLLLSVHAQFNDLNRQQLERMFVVQLRMDEFTGLLERMRKIDPGVVAIMSKLHGKSRI